jgi:hypothetical protein
MFNQSLLPNSSTRNAQSYSQAFEQVFVSPDFDNRITFLTRRICAAGRMNMGAGPVERPFWQGQIISFYQVLKAAMVNPIFKAGVK